MRTSSATIPIRKPKPVTAERIERALDWLTNHMIERGADGEKFLPLFERMESDLTEIREKGSRMAAVHERFRQLKDRTAA